jgi:hypothetical protein
VDWTDLADDLDRCWVLVNAVMDFGCHKMREIPGLAEEL